MKKVVFLVVFAVISLFASRSFSQDLYFNITNNSDYLFYGVHISPYTAGDTDPVYDWSDDLYPSDTFDPGATSEIYIPAGWYSSYCTFAVKVTYYGTDGGFYEKVLCYADACNYATLYINSDLGCTVE